MKTSKAAFLIMLGAITALSVVQCKKVGDVVSGLDRSLKGVPDSAVFASYYDTTVISPADATPAINDVIRVRGVQTIIKEYCGTSNCHGGAIEPKIFTYEDIMKYVTVGNPTGSKLWEYLTTNEFDKAMPPVSSNHEMSTTDKTIIYNWIRNGAKKAPNLSDFRPAAIRILVDGCGSANCHNQGTATGAWARKGGLIPGLVSADTTMYTYTNPGTGAQTLYCQLINVNLRNQVWNSYKDSVRKFYADTLANASFRPYKIFGTPISASSTRGPLNTYDDIMLDIMYPKGIRSNSSVQFTDANGVKFYVKGNYLNGSSSIISRIDSTLLPANLFTGVYGSAQGDMAYGDGGLLPSEIALIKAWYFADPNVPTVWKYGTGNVGIFKYKKTGTIIKQ